MKRKFQVPGVYHPITVKFVTLKKLAENEGENILGDYDHNTNTIRIAKDSPFEVRKHALYHEIMHHIFDTLEYMKDEEDKCDVLATYLIKLSEEKEKIESILK